MVFYLIGLGLGDVEDITVKGLNIVRKCKRVHLEAYTSILCYGLDKSKLEEFYGRELYNFGETVSIVMWLDGWEPDSYYDKIATNMANGFHTLCLLDIKTKEQSIENMMRLVFQQILIHLNSAFQILWILQFQVKSPSTFRGRKIYEPPRYLTCAEAATQLLKIAERKKEAGIEPAYNESSPCVGLARVGWDDQKVSHPIIQFIVAIFSLCLELLKNSKGTVSNWENPPSLLERNKLPARYRKKRPSPTKAALMRRLK
ncbi:hypothetical protein COOONC_06361 [Cooperia oncophora]